MSGKVGRQRALRGLAAVALVVGAALVRPVSAAGRSPMWGLPFPMARGGEAATPREVEGTGTVLSTIAVGTNPVALALDAQTHRVFVVNRRLETAYDIPHWPNTRPTPDGTVSVLDSATGTVLSTVRVGHRPHAAAVDEQTKRVFVLNEGIIDAGAASRGQFINRGSVTVLDASTGVVLRTASLGVSPYAVAVDERTGRVFVANRGAWDGDYGEGHGSVTVLDARTGLLLRTVPVGSWPVALAVDEQRGRVFVANEASNTVSVLDATTGGVLRTVDNPVNNPVGVAVAEESGHVFVGRGWHGGGSPGRLYMLDAGSGAVLRIIAVPSGPWTLSQGMVVDPRTGYLLVADLWAKAVLMVDAATGALVRTLVLDGTPWAIAVDERTGRVWVVNQIRNEVSVLGSHSGALLGTAEVGALPYAVVVDESTRRVFVANGDGNTVSMLDAGPVTVSAAQSGGAPVLPVGPACCGARYFPQTRHTMSGAFLAFYQQYGGLDTFGYPRTEPFTETGRLVQYTDRFALDLAGGQVQTAPLGRLLTAGRTFAPIAAFPSTAERLYFARTRHSLAGRFLAFWRTHHGATLLGAPIAEPTVEANGDGSGRVYQVQWCENGRLEYHPELAGTRYSVQIGLTGKQALQRRGWLSPA